MGLFDNKKNKYNVKENENVPQFVYGIPDTMRKKWEETDKKIDANCIFDAFEGGYFGPSYYYFINKYENNYYFRFGYSKDGKRIENVKESSNLHELVQDKHHYDLFIAELKNIIQSWNNKYNNNDIMDGTQWHIKDNNNKIDICGSNEFPNNYDKLVELLKKYFNVNIYVKEGNKYDIDPEDNMPREVYGIPDSMINKKKYEVKPEENIPQRVYGVPNMFDLPKTMIQDAIRINIKNNESNYFIGLKHSKYVGELDEYSLLFGNKNHFNDKVFSDLFTDIPSKYYQSFVERFNNIIQNWLEKYDGSSEVNWIIEIDISNNKKRIIGNGGYPQNWNEFIELLIEYERLFKQKKKIDIDTINDMKFDKLSFDEIVNNKVKDSFWANTIIKYFREELKESDIVAKVCFKDLMKYDDILNEFTKHLTQKTYDLKNPLEVNGYTAKQISELNPKFTASGVYTFMKLLRDDKDVAEKVIKSGFATKDAFPPTNNKVENEVEKYLKEIKPEVDKQLIEMGLLTITDGKEYPAFGSCHTRWDIEKRLLKEKYNIDWQTPAEKNPYIKYD